MNDKLKKILLMKLTFVSLLIYTNIFINYFFWQKTGELEMVILFGIMQWTFWLIPYTLGTLILLRNARWNYYISSASAVLTFVILWLFSDTLSVIPLMALVAFTTSFISTFFYSSNTVSMLSSAGSTKEMNRFISLEGMLTNLVSFAIPLLNGFIIYYLGFQWSFVFMILISVAYFIFSLNAIEVEKIEFKKFKGVMKKEKYSIKMIFYFILSMLGSRSLLIMGSIVLIVVSSNELEVSIWNAISVVVIFLLAMFIKRQPMVDLKIWSIVCIALLLVSVAIVIFDWNMIFLIIIQAVVVYLSRFVELSLPMKLMRRKKLTEKVVLSYKREVTITITKIIISLCSYFLYLKIGMDQLFIVILIVSMVSIFIMILINPSLEKELEKEKNAN